MHEDESTSNFYLRVDEVVNTMKGIGDEFEDSIIVEKILILLTPNFDAKVLAIEEMYDLNQLSRERLNGIVMPYEIRQKIRINFNSKKFLSRLQVKENKEK